MAPSSPEELPICMKGGLSRRKKKVRTKPSSSRTGTRIWRSGTLSASGLLVQHSLVVVFQRKHLVSAAVLYPGLVCNTTMSVLCSNTCMCLFRPKCLLAFLSFGHIRTSSPLPSCSTSRFTFQYLVFPVRARLYKSGVWSGSPSLICCVD